MVHRLRGVTIVRNPSAVDLKFLQSSRKLPQELQIQNPH